MRTIMMIFFMIVFSATVLADTLRDFTKNGIYIKVGDKTIKSTRLKYGMEIDFAPKDEIMTVYLKDKEGGARELKSIPTSANKACPKKIKKLGCHYTVSNKGSINSINKKYSCLTLCQ